MLKSNGKSHFGKSGERKENIGDRGENIMSNAMQDYLTQAAQRLRLSVDAQSGILFGNQGGMNMLLTGRSFVRYTRRVLLP